MSFSACIYMCPLYLELAVAAENLCLIYLVMQVSNQLISLTRTRKTTHLLIILSPSGQHRNVSRH